MNKIEHNHINGLIIKASKLLLNEGQLKSPRNYETLELMNVWFELTNPKKSVCTLPQRKLSRKYLNAELTLRAETLVNLDNEMSEKVLNIMEFMDDLDDVQEVHTNAEFPDNFEAKD